MSQHPKVVSYNSFKGLNNVLDPQSTDPTYLKKVLNIDIDKTGGLSKRKGYTKKDTASYTSLWNSSIGLGCYGVRNGSLVRLHSDYSYNVLLSNINDDQVSFEEVDDTIYLTSNSFNGIITNGTFRSWGIPKNTTSPNLTSSTGLLPEGTYQVSYTYVYSDGRESGTKSASLITISDNSKITLNIPTNPDVNIIYARVYCSTTDGSILFYSGIGILGSSYSINSTSTLVSPLKTFNLDKAPLGSIVKYYKGRVYIASGNILWYSEPWQYEYFKLDSNYIEFPEDIVEVMPVEDGLWIGSDRLYFLSGEEPSTFRRVTKEVIRVVRGTSTLIPGSYTPSDGLSGGYKWIVSSDLGIFMLHSQGIATNLSSPNVSLDSADSGSSIFLQTNGINQYLSILKTNQNPNNSVATDLVEGVIIRNGVVIP